MIEVLEGSIPIASMPVHVSKQCFRFSCGFRLAAGDKLGARGGEQLGIVVTSEVPCAAEFEQQMSAAPAT